MGKGDKYRPVDNSKFDKNYEAIKWTPRKRLKVKRKEKNLTFKNYMVLFIAIVGAA